MVPRGVVEGRIDGASEKKADEEKEEGSELAMEREPRAPSAVESDKDPRATYNLTL